MAIPIHFVGGEKGGVGKSVMARLLAQYCIDRDMPFRAFDADRSHGAMLRYYAAYSVPVELERFESLDRIVEEIAESGMTAIVDLPAQAFRPLSRWVNDTGLLEIAADMDLVPTFWHVMDDGSESRQLFADLLETFADRPAYVLTRNLGRGQDFSHLDDGLASWMARYGVRLMDLPALHAPTMRKIDHVGASFWAAANNTNTSIGPTLGLLERQRVRTWLNRVYAELDRVLAAPDPA